jgi:hypothetical protein
MSETSEKLEAFSTSLYVTDKAAYEECKRLLKLQGRSLSEELMEFIIRQRDELKGESSTDSTRDSGRQFEELKAQHFQLGQKLDKFKSVLEEKKAYDDCLEKFGKILGYNPGESSWEMGECVQVIVKFMAHGSDDAWKRAETQFLVSCKGGGIVHTFLDYLECVRERKKVERRLLALRTDPEELARLDQLERLEEERQKMLRETRKQREAEEARKQKEEDESEDPYEEEEEEEDNTEFKVDPNTPNRLTINDDEEEGAEEEGGE